MFIRSPEIHLHGCVVDVLIVDIDLLDDGNMNPEGILVLLESALQIAE